MEYTLLICDDDVDILSALDIYLSGEGYELLKAENGKEALEIISDNRDRIHLVLLDIMMPEMDGIECAVKIREFSNVPIIFLSAKSEDTDRILGLNIGADDYITKPFNPVELFARIKANIRRYARLGGLDRTKEIEPKNNIYRTGELVLDDNKKQVTANGEPVNLTAIEYSILKFLISRPDCVYSSSQIYEYVWNEPAHDVSRIISVHIRHIREKIEDNPKDPKYIKVVYGLGYKAVTIL